MFSIQPVCLALLYLANLASMASLSKNPQSSLIDDIMNQLLNSRKMDQLADKIAIKAAEKIADIQHISTAPPTDHVGEKVARAIEDVDKVVQNHEPEKTTDTTTADTNTEITENPDKSTQDTDTASDEDKNKADGLAVMEEFASIPKEKVNLNYQRFTTKDTDQPKAQTTDKTLRQLIESDERRADEKAKHSQEKIKDKNTKSDPKNKGKHKEKHNKKSTTKLPVIEDDLDEYETVDDDDKKESKSKVKDSKNITSGSGLLKTKEQSDSDSDNNKVVTTKENLHNEPSTKKARKDKIKKHKSKGDDSDFLKDELADAVGNVTDTDTRHIVRKQGEKLFAFVDNEDYNEYHDELAKKIKKSKKKTRRVEFSSNSSSE